MTSQKTNGLVSASTDQVLTHRETILKQATSTVPASYILVPTSHSPSFEIWGYSQMTSRQFKRLAEKRMRKQSRARL